MAHGLLLAGYLFAGYVFLVVPLTAGAPGFDSYAYWSIDLNDIYGRSLGNLGGFGAYRYSPAIAQLMAPFSALPWEVYRGGLMVVLAAASIACWRHALAVPPVAMSIFGGNIGMLFPLLLLLAMKRSTAWWAPLLLTKVFPGVGLVWYLARREWRPLLLALGVTAVAALASFAIYPRAWTDWRDMLVTNASLPIGWWPPLALRLAVAAVLVAWGARRGSLWVLPVAIELSTPAPWLGGPTLLIAIPGLRAGAARPATDDAAPIDRRVDGVRLPRLHRGFAPGLVERPGIAAPP